MVKGRMGKEKNIKKKKLKKKKEEFEDSSLSEQTFEYEESIENDISNEYDDE